MKDLTVKSKALIEIGLLRYRHRCFERIPKTSAKNSSVRIQFQEEICSGTSTACARTISSAQKNLSSQKILAPSRLAYLLIIFVIAFASGSRAYAEKLSGRFVLESSQAQASGAILLTFKQLNMSPGAVITLEANHVHSSLVVGESVELSGDVEAIATGRYRANQIMIFLKGGSSKIPIWLLARDFKPQKFKGAKYIEMHAPTSDYLVF